ncbi:MAG: DUF1295 domain-containing protein [Bacillota bacterium]|nr:DUF1295 domain-containing protein [Bacillota bacterium]
MLKKLRLSGFIALLLIYISAAILGIFIFMNLPGAYLYVRLCAADVAATIFIYIFSLILGNASVYDPYWSVAPIVILPLTAAYLKIWNTGVMLIIGIIMFWGLRLTLHWATTFKNLSVQDWRYTNLKASKPKLWFITNLFGIHLFPTLVVFFVMMPAIIFISDFTVFNIGIVLGSLISIFAIMMQAMSDRQMSRFRKNGTGGVNREGLWKYMRHPNYLGEILMWWGVFLMAYFADQRLWFCVFGAILNTLMFIFISVPMLEERELKSKPEYVEYKENTGMLLPNLKLILEERFVYK